MFYAIVDSFFCKTKKMAFNFRRIKQSRNFIRQIEYALKKSRFYMRRKISKQLSKRYILHIRLTKIENILSELFIRLVSNIFEFSKVLGSKLGITFFKFVLNRLNLYTGKT